MILWSPLRSSFGASRIPVHPSRICSRLMSNVDVKRTRKSTRETMRALRRAPADEAMRLYVSFRNSGPHHRNVWNEVLSYASGKPEVVRAAYVDMTAAKITPNEASFASLLRAEASSGDTAAALRVLDQMVATGVQPRLRSFAPLISAFAATAPAVAIRLMLRMEQEHVAPTDALAVQLVKAVLACDVDDHELQWAAVDEVFSRCFGRAVTPATALELQRVIDEATAKEKKKASLGASVLSWLLPSMDIALEHQVRCRPVSLSHNGACPVCGSGARLIGLESSEKRQMRKQLMRNTGNRRGGEVTPNERHDLAEFALWLKTRKGLRFTAAIDGANVAYQGQNHVQGGFSFEQIAEVVRVLRAEGHLPLVVLPRKYLSSTTIPNHIAGSDVARSNGSNYRAVTPRDREIRQAWEREGILYAPQHRWTEDDIYWMYLTVVSDTDPRVAVVTNDHARDHRAWMLEDPKTYFRWQTNHLRRFEFVPQERDAPLVVDIDPLPLYSREAQREAREASVHWHLPVEGSPAQARQKQDLQWLCLHIPRARSHDEGQSQEGWALEKLVSRFEEKFRLPR